MQSAQDIFFHTGLYSRLLLVHRQVMFLLKDLIEGDLTSLLNQTKSSLLEIISSCLQLLKLFVRSNPTYKNLLIEDIDIFLEFNTLNVGQSDLLSELFIDNKKANKSAQMKMINYFCHKIVSEGCQIKFLDYSYPTKSPTPIQME